MEQSRRPGGRSARVRRATLDAALDVLAEAGWTSATAEGIAERAGVNKTTIYRRWGSADAVLLDALLDRGSADIPVPNTGALRTDLIELGRSISALLSDPVGRAVASAAVSEPDAESIQHLANSFWAERFAAAGSVIDRAIGRGELPESVDPAQVVEQLAAAVWFRIMVRRAAVTEGWLAATVEGIV